ncbi:MAG: hypothetical protein F6J98_35085 [Moorea sp. SIO4G2]|nr:hypothetical protein [Moorena sp. SIO4G2]
MATNPMARFGICLSHCPPYITAHPTLHWTVPYSLFPIPYSLFPIPYSLFPTPYSHIINVPNHGGH